MASKKSAHSRLILFLIIIMLGLASCIQSPPDRQTQISLTPTHQSSPATGWLEIHFTDPTAPHAADYEGGPDEALAAAIDKARLSVDMAAYSLNLWSIRDALIHAYQRGVVVRMVMESDNMDTPEYLRVRNAGIVVVPDLGESLMHDKFVVIDHSEVWTGSMNYTLNGAYHDNNDLIRIRSAQVADDYTTEFNEMFLEKQFGPYARADTPNPSLTIDGTQMEIYFSPEDGVAAHILPLLQGAQESVYFMAYSFTADDLGAAIRQRATAGVLVSGVMDSDMIKSNQGTEYDAFMQAGLDLRRDGNAGLMHDKVIIIDRKIVITGSYNFTSSADDNNDENVVIIHNADIAAQYLEEFRRIYSQAHP